MADNLIQYLEAAAAASPNNIAVSMLDDNYTYEQLNYFAANLGRTIVSKGLDKGSAIGVFVNRGIDTVLLFMAALYSGNFYVPIDPDMTDEKISSVLQDAGIILVLGDSINKDRIRNLGSNLTLLTKDDIIYDDTIPLPAIGSDDPSYMVYTSGSTGKPKGVLKNHGAVISFVEAYQQEFSFSQDEIIGNQTPLFFDASAKDIYLALKCGTTLEIIPSPLFSTPLKLIEYMNDKKISFISWVPTALSLVAQWKTFDKAIPNYLRRVCFVGEVMPVKHLNTWIKALPDVEFVNLYGSSELSGICCYYKVDRSFSDDETLPIGKPISNCRVYLVDNDKLITQTNEIGEIYVVSDALASEYYHNKEKTDGTFVNIDFGEGVSRAYKTGDLAHYNEYGELVFSARSDYQIKHLGHRIELGEIEVGASSLTDIQRCCCAYDGDRSKIVLFCELTEGSDLTEKDIRAALSNKLSSYMVPGIVVILDKMPINANGKIDRTYLLTKYIKKL